MKDGEIRVGGPGVRRAPASVRQTAREAAARGARAGGAVGCSRSETELRQIEATHAAARETAVLLAVAAAHHGCANRTVLSALQCRLSSGSRRKKIVLELWRFS